MCHTIRILAQSLMIILGLWNMHPLGLLMPSIRLCIILVTFLIDSILKWGASTEVLNFFKFSIILYDPSFLGCIKILEKYPCPSCGDLTITPFFKSFSTSKFIILKRIYNDTNMGHYPPLSYSDSLLDPSSLYPKWNYLI